jgi:hypothetical protein
MILDHVAQCASVLIVAPAMLHPDGFGHGNLDMIDIAPVPPRLEERRCWAIVGISGGGGAREKRRVSGVPQSCSCLASCSASAVTRPDHRSRR